jgi:outer membrane protein assembly factor BamB
MFQHTRSMSRMREYTFWLLLVASGTLFDSNCAEAADWLHYRGPTANGAAAEGPRLPSTSALPVLWRANVGIGTSSVVVGAGKLYTQGHSAGAEYTRCLDATKGDPIWEFHHPVALDPNLFEGGSRATPTLAGDALYVLSHEGHLHCLDAATGAVRWQHHLVKDFAGRKPEWGFSGAPLVSRGRVYVDCGGSASSTVCLDAQTGQTVWKKGSDQAGYAAPLILNVAGRSTLVLLKAGALVGLDPEDGREFWRHPWKTSYDVNAATPLLIGMDRILISSGYNGGAALIGVGVGGVKELWRNKNLRAHINSPVEWGGAIFGVDGNTGGGNLVCLDASTGERRWEEKSVKGGALVVAGGALLIVSEKGDLVIAEATEIGYNQLRRQTVLNQRTWAQPVLANKRIYLRDNQGNLACLGL